MKKKYNLEVVKKSDVTEHHLSIQDDFTLFRYRPSNSYTLDALMKGDFWVSRPDSFNDPYDTSFVIDVESLTEYLLEKVDNERIIAYAKLRNIKSSVKKAIASKWISEIFRESMNFLKKLFLVACLSQDVVNEVMWAHYADNGKGFAIEYYHKDLRALKDYHCNLVNDLTSQFVNQMDWYEEIFGDLKTQDYSQYDIYRIIYTDDKYDATEIIKTSIDILITIINIEDASYLDVLKEYRKQGINIFDPKKQKTFSDSVVFTKKKIWKYEKEWRMLLPNLLIDVSKLESQHYYVGPLRPKAIYLGEYTNNATKMIVYNYCYTKGVDLYQMYSKMKKKSYGLCERKINKKEILSFLNKVEQK